MARHKGGPKAKTFHDITIWVKNFLPSLPEHGMTDPSAAASHDIPSRQHDIGSHSAGIFFVTRRYTPFPNRYSPWPWIIRINADQAKSKSIGR